jgi:acetyl/propionyl-CoA carboxylase alpha subunit
MITGLDLVEWQLRIAAGEPLPLAQEALAIRGHAVEARLYAEDAERGFLPQTGRLAHLRFPAAADGVRVDTGVEAGATISPHYDPMIAKLIAWGEDRPAALARLGAALAAVEIAGLKTNVAFLERVVRSRAFAAADLDTGLIERSRAELFPPAQPASHELLAAAAMAELLEEADEASARAAGSGDPYSPWDSVDGWRLNQGSHHDSATARLTVVDTALTDLIDRLTQAQTSVLSAQGSTKTDFEREVAAQALEGVRQAVLADLNTSFRGTYVFAGSNSTAPPFVAAPDGSIGTYQGATQEVAVDVGEHREVTTGFDGSLISQGGAAADVFATLDAAIAAARAGDHAGLQQARIDLQAAQDRATAVQMRVGTSLAAIDAQHLQLTDREIAVRARIASLEDANMAEAITGMNQADAAYRAALGAASRMTQLSLLDYLK